MKFTPQNFEVGKTYVTAYKNSITIDNSKNATITIFDKWRTNKDSIRNKVFKVNLRVAELYFYIESRFKEVNPPLVYTTQHDKEFSWGFYKRYRNINESIEKFYPLPIWIHFTGGTYKKLNIDISIYYKTFLLNSIIPTNDENCKQFNKNTSSKYIMVNEIISQDTIEEIMDIILKIKL